MIDPSWTPVEVTEFGGAITAIDAPDVPQGKALTADNCVFVPGAAGTRKGFGTAYDVNEPVTSMDNWVSNLGNYAVYHTADTIRLNHTDSTEIDANWVANTYASYVTDSIIEDSTSGVEHYVYTPFTATAGRTYLYSVDVKANGRTFIAISSQVDGYRKTWFDISGGTVETTASTHTASITNLGNGWYRCQSQFAATVSGEKTVVVYLSSGDAVTIYNGDGSSGVYFEAAKVTEVAAVRMFDIASPSVTTLIADTDAHAAIATPAASRNYIALLDTDGKSSNQGRCVSYQADYPTITADFADAAWSKTRVTVDDDATQDPNGGSTADKLVDTTDALYHFTYHTGLSNVADGSTITASVYAKAAEHTRMILDITDRSATDNGSLFNLDGGSVVASDPGVSKSSIVDVGGGWYKCSTTASIKSGSTTASVKIFLDSGSGSGASAHSFTGNGTDGIYIWGPNVSLFNTDKLFPPPLTYTPSAPTEPSSGEITAGAHNLAYAIEYRGGFVGRLCPDSGSGTPSVDTFTPVSKTAAGSKNFSWVLNTTWPADAVKVHVAMSPVSRPDLYIFVPGATASVTGGASESHTITFDVTDEFLMSILGTSDATNHRFWYTQTTAGVGPFNPHAIVKYGDRMAYITEIDDGVGNNVGAAIVSERNKFQSVSLDFSLVQLPGQIDITTGFEMNGALYLLSPTETYMTRDNSLTPSEWPAAFSVGTIGTVAVRGVDVADAATDMKIAFVAAKSGLYAFSGRYDKNPMSYLQEDVWNTINWDYAHLIQVKDIPHLQTVAVAVPLGDATSLSHVLTWCYRKGVNYAQADYSKWSFSDFDIGALAVMKNTLSSAATGNSEREELWVAPSDADEIRRQMTDNDSTPWRDGSAGIPFTYRTAALPRAEITEMQRHHGAHHRVTGSGTLTVKAKSIDGGWSKTLRSITLSSAPDKNEWRPFHKMMPRTVYEYSHTAADEHVLVSGIKHYVSRGPQHR